jgi:hypothetical protein
MGQVATMTVKLSADIVSWQKNLDSAEKTFLKSVSNIEKAGKEMSLAVTVPLVAIAGAMTKFAADDEAAMVRFSRIFGPASDAMKAFEKQALLTIPATTGEMDKLLTTTQNFVEQMGIAPRAATALTQQLTTMAADMAAFNGVGIDDAMNALEKGIAGKTRGLVQLGVVITSAMVKQEAYRMGLAATGSELSQSAIAEATLSLIRTKAANQMGEAARTADNAANSFKFLKSATEELLGEWGKELIPAATNVVHTLTDVERSVADLPAPLKDTAIGLGLVAAAAGPVIVVTGSLIRNLTAINALLKTTTGTAGLLGLAKSLGSLSVIAAPLAFFAALLYKSGDATRAARAETDQFTASLGAMTKAQLAAAAAGAQRGIVELDADVAALIKRRPKAPKGPSGFAAGKGAGSFEGAAGEDPALEAQIRAVQLQHDKLMSQLAAVRKAQAEPGHVTIPGGGADAGVDKLSDMIGTLVAQIDQIAKFAGPLPAEAQSAYDSIGKALATLNNLGSAFVRNPGESGTEFKKRVDEIGQLQDALAKVADMKFAGLSLPKIDMQAGLDKQIEKIYKAALDSVPKQQLADSFLQPLRDAVDTATVQAARLSIENAAKIANGQTPVDVDKAMAGARTTAANMAVDLKRAVDAMNLPGTPSEVLEEKKRILEAIDTLLKSINAGSTKSPVDHLAESLTVLGTGLHGLADAANALGQQQLGGILNSAGNLASNVSSFSTADSAAAQITAGAGIIGSSIAIFASVFGGQTALQKETQQLMATNNQRLQDVAVKLSGFTSGGANVDRVAQFMRAVSSPLSGSLGLFGLIGGLSDQMKLLGPILAQYGLTIAQVEQAAKDLGFTIQNANGTINQTAFQAFATGIADATKAVFKFGATMSDQQSYLDLADKLAGKTTDQDALNRAIQLIRTVAPAMLPGNVDTSSAAGRAAIRKQLQDDLARAMAGTISIADFGGFQNIGEFESAIGSAADGLNTLDNAANSLTATLSNVPSGFKIALDRYIASAPTLPGIPGAPPVVPGTDTIGPVALPIPTTPMYPASGNTAAPQVTYQGNTYTVSINVDGATLADPAMIADTIASAVQDKLDQFEHNDSYRGGATVRSNAQRRLQ